MGRWKPPRRPGSPYITAAGYVALQSELKTLWLRRRDVVTALSAAAAEGDRSENAEYIYRKKELGGIDRRIRYLQIRMPKLEIVRHRVAPEQVFFGADITLDIPGSGRTRYRLVGEDETDPAKGHINIDSPLAKSLMKKRVGDVVKIMVDSKEHRATIEAINYELDEN